MKAMNKLYKQVFMPLYKWGKKAFSSVDGKLLHIHYKFLHQAPPERLVYRGIERSRLKKICR